MIAVLLLAGALAGAADPTLDRELGKRVLSPGEAQRDLHGFFGARERPGPERFTTPEAWQREQQRVRQTLLDEVFLQGAVKEWAQAPVRVEEAGAPLVGQWHQVRRFRMEIVPGLWTSMWLHEPLLKPRGKVPVVMSFIGHVSGGDATAAVHQARAIHLARQGLYVVTVEWFANGELDLWVNTHMALNHIDLWGTHGVGLMYLLMTRGLDYALRLEHADPTRVAATGLSGGGWQTIILTALDPRVTLAAPVAGFTGYATSSRVQADLGDSEQAAADLQRIADYPTIAALVAPRPLLLTYNEPDSCCFRAGRVVPLLSKSLEPVYALLGAEDALRFHINKVPGTHNYEEDNRRAFYRMLVDHGFVGETPFEIDEDDVSLDVRTPDELIVGMPAENKTLMKIAADLAGATPRRPLPDAATFASWRAERSGDLEKLLVTPIAKAGAWKAVRSAKVGDLDVRSHLVKIGSFSVPVIVVSSNAPSANATAKGTVLVLADGPRESIAAEVAELARARRVVIVEPLHFGDRMHRWAEAHYSMMMGSIGEPSLGIQTAELAAIAAHYAKEGPVELRAIGKRSSFIAVVTSARSAAVASVSADGYLGSFASLSAPKAKASIYKQPEIYLFGLGQKFTTEELLALSLTKPLEVRIVGKGVDRAALSALSNALGAPSPTFR